MGKEELKRKNEFIQMTQVEAEIIMQRVKTPESLFFSELWAFSKKDEMSST